MLLRIPLMIVRHYKLDNTIASSDRQFLLKIFLTKVNGEQYCDPDIWYLPHKQPPEIS